MRGNHCQSRNRCDYGTSDKTQIASEDFKKQEQTERQKARKGDGQQRAGQKEAQQGTREGHEDAKQKRTHARTTARKGKTVRQQ